MRTHALAYGVGALILGCVGLTSGEFLMQWQPVPDGAPLQAPLAYLSAAILLASGASIVLPTHLAPRAPAYLGAFFGLWVLLHLPRVVNNPADVATWNGFAELLAMAAGGMASLALVDAKNPESHPVARVAPRVFGGCLLVFGLAHFVYDDFSATMVPRWLHVPLFWVYLTGCGHLAAGVSLMSGVAARLAATWLAGMIACFVVLLHVPRVIAAPASRVEWIMLGISISLLGAAWLIRSVVSQSELHTQRQIAAAAPAKPAD